MFNYLPKNPYQRISINSDFVGHCKESVKNPYPFLIEDDEGDLIAYKAYELLDKKSEAAINLRDEAIEQRDNCQKRLNEFETSEKLPCTPNYHHVTIQTHKSIVDKKNVLINSYEEVIKVLNQRISTLEENKMQTNKELASCKAQHADKPTMESIFEEFGDDEEQDDYETDEHFVEKARLSKDLGAKSFEYGYSVNNLIYNIKINW